MIDEQMVEVYYVEFYAIESNMVIGRWVLKCSTAYEAISEKGYVIHKSKQPMLVASKYVNSLGVYSGPDIHPLTGRE